MLSELIARVSRDPSVTWIQQIGSLTDQKLKPDSDYDLVLVLDGVPQPWYVGITCLDGRFTDLNSVDRAEIPEHVIPFT